MHKYRCLLILALSQLFVSKISNDNKLLEEQNLYLIIGFMTKIFDFYSTCHVKLLSLSCLGNLSFSRRPKSMHWNKKIHFYAICSFGYLAVCKSSCGQVVWRMTSNHKIHSSILCRSFFTFSILSTLPQNQFG